MYKWKVSYIECDAGGKFWPSDKHEVTVYTDLKEVAIQKALDVRSCEHYRDLTAEIVEILPSEDKQTIALERAHKLIQKFIDKTIESKGLREGLEFLFDCGFTARELIDFQCGADNAIEIQGDRREHQALEQASPTPLKVFASHVSTDSHDGEPYYKCSACGKTFGYFAARKGNWKSPDFYCPHCKVEVELGR